MILLSAYAGIAEGGKRGQLAGSALRGRLQHAAMVSSAYRYFCTRCLDALPEFSSSHVYSLVYGHDILWYGIAAGRGAFHLLTAWHGSGAKVLSNGH